jgi:Zn-dependent protease with chaperone function/type II secretory pathway pseudopilin PulG
MDTIYKSERPLFAIALLISLLVWTVLMVVTFGIALLYVLLFFIIYLFVQSAFISYLKGTAVHITAAQFPDLHQRVVKCSEKLGIRPVPDAYILHAHGAFNALATRFLGRNFIVLYSDVVDALESNPDAVDFYIGHELGHIQRKHLVWGPVLWPALILPILGAAYSRAREYTCDLYGARCCVDSKAATDGLAALAVGHKRWHTLNVSQYTAQIRDTSGFWMSFHELISDYPWLTKRMARISAKEQLADIPNRNPLALLLAIFIPRLGVGGGPASILIFVAIIGILAAVAIPAYQDYTVRAKMSEAIRYGNQASEAVAAQVTKTGEIPQRLEDVGLSSTPDSSNIRAVQVNGKTGIVQIVLAFPPLDGKSVLFIPSMGQDKKITWRCASEDIAKKYLPQACR